MQILKRVTVVFYAIALACAMATLARAADADKDAKAEKPATKEAKDQKASKDAKDDKADKPEKEEKGATTKKAGAGDAKSLTAAVTALSKEYELFSKDPVKNPLRADANYFKDNPTDASPADIIAVLDKPIKGADKKAEAYVKWQLVAALPEKLDPKDEQKLFKLYDKAPAPIDLPGAGKEEQAKLQGQVSRLGPGKAFDFNEKFLEAVANAQGVNGPIVAYRNALFKRLPGNYDTYVAGFKDSYLRFQAGLDTEPLMGDVISGVETWAQDAKPGEIANMHKLVSGLVAEPAPPIYTGIKDAEKGGGYQLIPKAGKLDDGRLAKLATLLEDHAKNAGGGGGGGGGNAKKGKKG